MFTVRNSWQDDETLKNTHMKTFSPKNPQEDTDSRNHPLSCINKRVQIECLPTSTSSKTKQILETTLQTNEQTRKFLVTKSHNNRVQKTNKKISKCLQNLRI